MAQGKSALKDWLDQHVGYVGNDCLFWPYNGGGGKYPMLYRQKKAIVASRYMCIKAHGDPPTPKHEAAHRCGRGADGCLNPNHLSWATRLENETDKTAHGSRPVGERNGAAKLSKQDVRRIIALYEAGHTQRAIAIKFGLHFMTVHKIVNRQLWSHLQININEGARI